MALFPSLEAIESFGADHYAAAVVGRAGVLAERGDRDRPFRLASVTKLLTAYAALIAFEERTVRFDDPVGPPGSTLAHVLSHASGLGPNDREKVRAPVGTRRIYSNAGIELAALHVQARAEMPFPEYLDEAIFTPLKMKSAALEESPAHKGRASLADSEAFVSELLAPTLIAPATLALATSVAFPGLSGLLPGFGRQRPCDWGLGFEIRDDKRPHWTGSKNSARTFGHFGQSGTFLWVDPEPGLALIVLTDRAFGKWAAAAWPVLSDAVLAEARAAI